MLTWTRAWTRQFRYISLQMCTGDGLPSSFVNLYVTQPHVCSNTVCYFYLCNPTFGEWPYFEWKFQQFTFKPKKIQLLLTYNAYRNVTRPPPKIPVITGFHPSAPVASSVQHAVKISLNIRILCYIVYTFIQYIRILMERCDFSFSFVSKAPLGSLC
jgi:hypothetical protein